MSPRTPLAALALVGCLAEAPLDEGPCPCADGYFCCESKGMCLPEGDDTCAPGEPLALAPTSGPVAGGTEVVLTGAGVEAATQVRFGGRPAEILEAGNSLRVRVPAGALDIGRVDVVVEDASGVRAVPGGFQYLLPPFAEATAARGLTGTTRGIGATVIDLDGQHGLDLVMARIDPTLSFFFQGDGRGRFAEARPPWGDFTPQTASVAIADFTGDGRLDLAPASFASDAEAALVLLPGQTDGFGPPRVVAPSVGLAGGYPLLALDLDQDGDADLVGYFAAANQPGRIEVFRNVDGTLVADPDAVTYDFDPADRLVATHAGDFDGDGATDVVLVGTGVLLLRQVEGRLVDESRARDLPAIVPHILGGVTFADIDSDGDLDLSAWPDTADHNRPPEPRFGTSIWRNDGARFTAPSVDVGSLLPAQCLATVDPQAALTVGTLGAAWLDHDLDGDLDLLLPQPSWSCETGPMLLENTSIQGQLRFTSTSLDQGRSAVAMGTVATFDADRDGDDDAFFHGWTAEEGMQYLHNNARENGAERPARIEVRRNGLPAVDGTVIIELPDGRTLARVIGGEGNLARVHQPIALPAGATRARVRSGGAVCDVTVAPGAILVVHLPGCEALDKK